MERASSSLNGIKHRLIFSPFSIIWPTRFVAILTAFSTASWQISHTSVNCRHLRSLSALGFLLSAVGCTQSSRRIQQVEWGRQFPFPFLKPIFHFPFLPQSRVSTSCANFLLYNAIQSLVFGPIAIVCVHVCQLPPMCVWCINNA